MSTLSSIAWAAAAAVTGVLTAGCLEPLVKDKPSDSVNILPHGANGPAVDVITTKVASVIGKLKQP